MTLTPSEPPIKLECRLSRPVSILIESSGLLGRGLLESLLFLPNVSSTTAVDIFSGDCVHFRRDDISSASRTHSVALEKPKRLLTKRLEEREEIPEDLGQVSRVSMVVVLNGVLADDCPTSVRALLAAHPGYRDAAAQLLAAAARVVGPQGLLYVAQRELAAVVPHDKNVNIIGSDDATSCIIVVVRHAGSGAIALAHLDGLGTADAASAMVSRVQQLAVGYPEGRLELQLVGGFTDPHRYSDDLFANIMLSFHRLTVEIDLTLACCCELNTALGGGTPAPLVTGVGVDIRAGDLFPATFPDKGPELPLRAARHITCGPHSSQVLDIYDNGVGMLRIGPFNYDPLRGVDLWLEQSDDFILQHLSTTPANEPPHFVHHIRQTLKFIQQHPFPAVTVFPDNRPHYYRRDEQTGCWVLMRF